MHICNQLLKTNSGVDDLSTLDRDDDSSTFLHWINVTSIVEKELGSFFLKKLQNKIKFIFSHKTLSSGNSFVSGAGGLRFKSRAGQIGPRVANGSPPLRHFFEKSCVARAQ